MVKSIEHIKSFSQCYHIPAKNSHEPIKEKKKSMWTYRHFMSRRVLKISDKNLRRLLTQKHSSLQKEIQVKIPQIYLLETLTFPILTWPFFDTILFLSFSWWGSKLRKCFPASSLRTMSPRPRPIFDLADSRLPLRELLQENSDSAWPSRGLDTLICLMPPLPSSTVTRVGLSNMSSWSSSMSESKTSSEVEAASLCLDGVHLDHQWGMVSSAHPPLVTSYGCITSPWPVSTPRHLTTISLTCLTIVQRQHKIIFPSFCQILSNSPCFCCLKR